MRTLIFIFAAIGMGAVSHALVDRFGTLEWVFLAGAMFMLFHMWLADRHTC